MAFQKKLAAHEIKTDPRDPHRVFESIRLIPLDEYHYSSINRNKSFQFYYLILFSVAGALVILCSLFNYISLFITRMRIRSREIELRKVCGSSIGGVFILLFIEYLYIWLWLRWPYLPLKRCPVYLEIFMENHCFILWEFSYCLCFC